MEQSIQLPYAPQGLRLIGVNKGEFADPYVSVPVFAEVTGVTFELLIDQGAYDDFAWPDGFGIFPRQVLIGEDGVIRYLASSYDPGALQAAVIDALSESAQ